MKDFDKLLGEENLLSGEEKISMIKENLNIPEDVELLRFSLTDAHRDRLLELTGEFIKLSHDIHGAVLESVPEHIDLDDGSEKSEMILRSAMMAAMAASAVPWAVAIRVVTTALGGDAMEPEEFDKIREVTGGAWNIGTMVAGDVYKTIFAEDDEDADEDIEE